MLGGSFNTGGMPPSKPADPADEASDDAINDFVLGTDDISRSFGQDDPWTQAMKKHQHIEKLRWKIKQKIVFYCCFRDGKSTVKIGQSTDANFSLNSLSIWDNAKIFIKDVLAGLGVVSSAHSTGSFRLQYTIESIDCKNTSADVSFTASDQLRLGSLTRIPKTNVELLPDRSGPNRHFNSIDLEWEWDETVK